MFSWVVTETQKYPGAQEYYGFCADKRGLLPSESGSRSVLYPRSCKHCTSRGWSGFTQRRGKWISRWNSLLQDMVWYGLCSKAMSGSIAKVWLSVSVTLYLHPDSSLRMNSVDFIKRDFSLLRSAGNMERLKCTFSRSLIKHGSWSGRKSRVLSPQEPAESSDCCLSDCGAGWNPCLCGKSDHRNLKAIEHLPSMSWPCSNLK